MHYRHLGSSDLELSEVGLGTWAIGGPYWTEGEPTGWGGPLDEDDICRAINLAVESGINHFDTADVYGYGVSERILARALARQSSNIVIATKVGWAATTAPHVYSAFNIRRQCEQSLRNLRRDYIDLYYFHHCDFGEGDQYLEEAVEAMLSLKQEGKIRHVGLSGYSEEEILRVLNAVDPVAIQSWADIEHDEFIREESSLRKVMEERRIGFVAMMPFGQGRLLGKYAASEPPNFEPGDNRIGNSGFTRESLTELGPRLDALRERFGPGIEDLAFAALAFVLAHPIVSSVIPGFRNELQVKLNLVAANRDFTNEDLEYIHSVFPRDEMPPHPWTEE